MLVSEFMLAGFMVTCLGQIAVIIAKFQYFSSSNPQSKDRSYWKTIQVIRSEKPLHGNVLLGCFVLMYPFGVLAGLLAKLGL